MFNHKNQHYIKGKGKQEGIECILCILFVDQSEGVI